MTSAIKPFLPGGFTLFYPTKSCGHAAEIHRRSSLVPPPSSSVPAKVSHLCRRFLPPHLSPSLARPLRPFPKFLSQRNVGNRLAGETSPTGASDPRRTVTRGHPRNRRGLLLNRRDVPRVVVHFPCPETPWTSTFIDDSSSGHREPLFPTKNDDEPPPSFPILWI